VRVLDCREGTLAKQVVVPFDYIYAFVLSQLTPRLQIPSSLFPSPKRPVKVSMKSVYSQLMRASSPMENFQTEV
jgi:hypothetical protein